MIEHTRLTLEVIGIDVWVSRDTPTHFSTNSLYRDQEYALPTELHYDNVITEQPCIEAALTEIESPAIDHIATETHTNESVAESLESIQESPIPQFNLQVMELEHYAVVVNIQDACESVIELWSNINKALPHEEHSLVWPPIMDMPNNLKTATSYTNGFIIANFKNKKLIILGELPISIQLDHISMHSLEDMTLDPNLKRDLWNMIKN